MAQSDETLPEGVPTGAFARRYRALFGMVPVSLGLLLGRLALAALFWQMGRANSDGFLATQDLMFTYEFEYRLPLVNPYVAAVAITLAQQLLAVMLVLGIATRAAALGLLVITAIIQLYIAPGEWIAHAIWAALLVLLMAYGAGRFSLDWVIGTRFSSR